MNSMSLLNFNLDSDSAISPTNAFKVEGEHAGFHIGANFYSEKYDMIIACPLDNTVQFYNPTTLFPIEGRKPLQLNSSVLQILYYAKTDVCLLMCQYGNMYSYDLSKHILTQEQKLNEKPQKTRESLYHLLHPSNQIAFPDSDHYLAQSRKISIGKFIDVRRAIVDQESAVDCLWKSEKGKLLFTGLADGTVRVYRTDQLPKLPVIESVKVWKIRGDIAKIEDVMIKGKEYVIAAESNGTIRIWQLIKGKLRLVRVIYTGERIWWFAYLEKYQLIVTTHGKEYIRYWSLVSGKYKFSYYSKMIKSKDVFLMNGKNSIGIADYRTNMIEVVPLNFKENWLKDNE